MKRLLALVLGVVFSLSFFAAGCARQPSEKRSAKIISSYFEDYGKKYKDTVYGQSPVETVELTRKYEIRKHLVAVEAFLTMKDGNVRRIHATIEKGPMGWRFVSWENAS
jgi:hypothetical protein